MQPSGLIRRCGLTMLYYIFRRVLMMIPTLVITSALIFAIIEAPPGDYLESYIAELQAQGEAVDNARIEYLRKEYGFDKSPVERYFNWVGRHVRRRFRLFLRLRTAGHRGGRRQAVPDHRRVSVATIIFTWLIAFPIGIYSATRQYSWGDYGFTFLGLLGLAIPNFLLALVLMYLANVWFGTSIGGLVDPAFADQPMSWAKFVSVLQHLWVPVLVIGTAGTAGMIRRIRANLLDELQKQYVTTARAKGLHPFRALVKYPLRMSLNFFISDIGSLLPAVISGAEVVAIVLSLETTGPLLISALQQPGHVSRRLVPDVPVAADGRRRADLRHRARLSRSAHPVEWWRPQMTLPANATRLPHTVSDRPFDPDAIYKYTDAQKALFEASQLQADVVEVPPPQAGADLRRYSSACSICRS